MLKNLKLLFFACIVSAIVSATATYFTLQQHPDLTPADGVLVNGMNYHGDLQNGLLQGIAVLEGNSGQRYSGFFVDGLIQGQGSYSDRIGGNYVGTFIDGNMEGEGAYEYYDGSKYVGTFKKNALHGKGEFSYSNGDQYTGDFSAGFMQGEGIYVVKESISYEGRFENNEFVEGKALLHGTVQEGEFSNWALHGKGKVTDERGNIAEGVYIEGVLNGQGTQALADGSKYQGEFKDGMKHGSGTWSDAEGDIYTGSFEYGRYHGDGELVLATAVDGLSRVSGQWKWGYLEDDPRDPTRNDDKKVEKLLYSQNALLEDALAKVEDTETESADLFFLGVAGYGDQDVFLKEIQYLRNFMQPYAGNRSLTLVNNRQTLEEFPLATRHSVQEVLGGIEEKMDVENDVLFVYMTSHGSKNHEFSIELNGLSLPALSHLELADAFRETKIKWKIIVISACYSGGFVDQLANDNTLVITAARRDRTSFGCSDDSDMTYFGRAYLKEALPSSLSFVQAFYRAQGLVGEWESRDFPDAKRSEPQISLGKHIEKKLENWQHPLGG